ncbi:helix-turn-helix domain-containing protein [Micromonospora sp. LH3U1]|nr:helix-turn-helix domain-containing protein [Micromonospora sp. LH3U1]WCN80026.1 helix-turn-helix domain-containing protein [Micromonospora sp. LH3U1]
MERATQELRVLELRRRGVTYEQIAAEMGISRRTVERRYQEALQRVGSDTAEQVRREAEDQIYTVRRYAYDLLDLPNLTVSERSNVLRLVLQCNRERVDLLGAKWPSHMIATLEIEANGLEVPGGARSAR